MKADDFSIFMNRATIIDPKIHGATHAKKMSGN